MKLFRIFLSLIVLLSATLFFYPHSALAVSYDLIAPSSTLTRGQPVQFVVNIDSQGSTLNSTEIGMTYQSQYLEYVSVTPGDAMTSVTATPVGSDSLLISGTNSTGFNGTGVLAYVTFNLIATAPGTAELCALFAPSTTPTPVATTVPVPTELPKTGTVQNTALITLVGGILFVASIASFAVLKRSSSPYPYRNKKY